MISVHFQGKPFNIAVIQVYVPITNAREAEGERFYEDLQDLLEDGPFNHKRCLFSFFIKNKCPFHNRGLECKTRKLRDSWSNRKVWPWSTK